MNDIGSSSVSVDCNPEDVIQELTTMLDRSIQEMRALRQWASWCYICCQYYQLHIGYEGTNGNKAIEAADKTFARLSRAVPYSMQAVLSSIDLSEYQGKTH